MLFRGVPEAAAAPGGEDGAGQAVRQRHREVLLSQKGASSRSMIHSFVHIICDI